MLKRRRLSKKLLAFLPLLHGRFALLPLCSKTHAAYDIRRLSRPAPPHDRRTLRAQDDDGTIE